MNPADARRRTSRRGEADSAREREFLVALVIVGAFMMWFTVTIGAVLALLE